MVEKKKAADMQEEAIAVKKREEISPEFKWAIQDLYADDREWEKEFEKLKEMGESFCGLQGKLGVSGAALLKALRSSDEINQLSERVYVYANQRLHENTGSGQYQVLAAKAQSLMTVISDQMSFLVPEILQISDEELEQFYIEADGLEVYRTYLNGILRRRAHVLSQEMESLLAKVEDVADGPSQIFSMFNNADLKFGKISVDGQEQELTHGRYVAFMENPDRQVREQAFREMYRTYQSFRNTLAATYQSNVKQSVFFARTRNYDSSRAAALDGGNIPLAVYDNLIEAVHQALPSLHKYMEVRKKALKLDELHMYDLYVPIISELDMKIDFTKAKQIVKEGLNPLGGQYLAHLEEGYEQGWIDVYENEGKRSGAYSWGAYGTHPYVLLNHQDNLNSTFTLAHEMGHALHSYYSDNKQPYVYAGYKIFVAEVASTCNEALLIHHLIEKAQDRKEKAYLINYFLEQFRGTVYRQTMFAEFEKITHQMEEQGEALTSEALCKVYYELNQKYYGAQMCVDQDIEIEWARIPHFYTPFYVYQYATGFSAAIAIAGKILAGDEHVLEGYFQFLSGGSSMDPIDLLKLCGVDMTSTAPVAEALQMFNSYVQELEMLLNE